MTPSFRHDLDVHLRRVGLRDAMDTDAMTKMSMTMVSHLLDIISTAMEDENVPYSTITRVLKLVIYGAVGSPVEVEYRQQMEKIAIDTLNNTPFPPSITLDQLRRP